MVKRLVVTRNAYLDIDRIIEFNNLRNYSDTYSRKFVKALFKQFKVIQKQPGMGVSTRKENVLLLIWDSYYVYYSVGETFIEILAIFHQREDVSR
jgi:plasmid stabilization system protein ParE